MTFMLFSHRRSDQLDRLDHIYSPMKLDQAGLNAHPRLLHDYKSTLHDVLRLLLDDNPTNISTFFGSRRPIRESYTISTRLTGPLLDRCPISTRPDRNDRNRVVNNARVEAEMIVFRSGKRCIPDQTRSLHNLFSNN
jgi:hypothetical protein